MDLLKNVYLDNLSHDLMIDGTQSFYDKILTADLSFFCMLPYPVENPLKYIDQNKVKSFLNHDQTEQEKRQVRREFSRMRNDITERNLEKDILLPNFFIDYVENATSDIYDYGFNISYSRGVLEKFNNQGKPCLIRPGINNDLLVYKISDAEEKITLKWLSSDPILNIQNMDFNDSNSFIVRGRNTIYLMDIDSDFQMKIDIKLNCNVGYLDCAHNHVTKTELALVDSKNKLKLFDLGVKEVSCSYTIQDFHLHSRPRLIKVDYLTQNMLMIMTDKEIRVLDTRCKDVLQNIDIKLDNCDMLLNFTLDKNKEYFSDSVYLTSKHSFFVHDIRTTVVNDSICHQLKSPPCYINYFHKNGMQLMTLFSQSPNEQALFGIHSPYSLPYHLNSLENTFDKCRSQRAIPVIPNIEQRLNYPIKGVQIIPNKEGASVYYCNLFGELFLQDILLTPSHTEEPIDKMHEWLTQIYEQDDPDLNVVHIANASAAFEIDAEHVNLDVVNPYEKIKIHEFLENENFDFTKWNAEAFLEIWSEDEDDLNILFESEPSNMMKVKNWIENAKFDIADDL